MTEDVICGFTKNGPNSPHHIQVCKNPAGGTLVKITADEDGRGKHITLGTMGALSIALRLVIAAIFRTDP